MTRNPFLFCLLSDGTEVQIGDAAGRIDAVKKFGTTECLDALALPGLQSTVKKAIQRRLRALDRADQRRQ